MWVRPSFLLAVLPWGVFGGYGGSSTPSGCPASTDPPNYTYYTDSTSKVTCGPGNGYSSVSPAGGYPPSSASVGGGYSDSSASADGGYPGSSASPGSVYNSYSTQDTSSLASLVTASPSSTGHSTGPSTVHSTGHSTGPTTGPSNGSSTALPTEVSSVTPSGSSSGSAASSLSVSGNSTASLGSTGSSSSGSSSHSKTPSASTQKTPTGSASATITSSVSTSSGLSSTTGLSTGLGSTLSTGLSTSSISNTSSVSATRTVSTTLGQSISSNSTLSTSLSITRASSIGASGSSTAASTLSTSSLSSSTNSSTSTRLGAVPTSLSGSSTGSSGSPTSASQSSTASSGSISSSGSLTTISSTGSQTTPGSSTGLSASPTSLSGSSSQSTAQSSIQATAGSSSSTTGVSSGQSTAGSSGQSTAESSAQETTGSSLSSPVPSASSPGSLPSSTGPSTLSPQAGSTTPSPESSTTVLATPSSSRPVSITSTSVLTSAPPVNTSIPFIAATHQVKFDNITYFMPRCDDEPEILWLSDGTNFTLYCDRMVLFNGTLITMPPDVGVDTNCTGLGLALEDACFWARWDKKPTNPTTNSTAPWCNALVVHRFASRSNILDESPGVPLSEIANKLVDVNSWTCAAAENMQQVAARFFNMMMEDLAVVKSVMDFIKAFFGDLYGDTDGLLIAILGWIDQVDQAFLELYCFIDTEDGHTSRIWRGLLQHHNVHRGLNLIISIHHAVHLNLIEKILELILGMLFWGVRLRTRAFIGSFGAGMQSWTQIARVCKTNYTEPALENPQNEEPEEGDEEEGWMPRYLIEAGKGMTALAQLRAVEGVLGRPVGGVSDSDEDGPWEIGASASGSDLSPSLLVDLQPTEYLMAKAALGNMKITKRPTWDSVFGNPNLDDPGRGSLRAVGGGGGWGFGNDSDSDSDSGGYDGHGSINKRDDEPFYPRGDTTTQNRAAHVNFVSRPKAEGYKYDIHKYHSSQGEGTYIFILDAGFTTAQYEGAGGELGDRQILKYVVPNQYTVPKRPPWANGKPVPDSIDDNIYPTSQQLYEGHGATMASVAAGKKYGIASKANLVFVKMAGGAIMDEAKPDKVTPAPRTREGFSVAMEYVYNQVTSGAIPPGRSVVCIAQLLGLGDTPEAWLATWEEWVSKLDYLGVTIVAAAGNGGFNRDTKRVNFFADDYLPGMAVGTESPVTLVGGVYPDGSLWESSSPCNPGTAWESCFISIYAPASQIKAYISAGGKVESRVGDGTSQATALTAGLAAYFLGYPWPEGKDPFDTSSGYTVGALVKNYLQEASYQRTKGDPKSQTRWFRKNLGKTLGVKFPWTPPSWVNSVYNYAEGNQRCKEVRGLKAGLKMARDDGGGTCPIPSPTSRNIETFTAAPTDTETGSLDGFATTVNFTVTSGNTIFTSFLTWIPSTDSDSATSESGPTITSASPTNSSTVISANSTITTTGPMFTNSTTMVSANSTAMFTNSTTMVSANRTITMTSAPMTTNSTTTITPSSNSSSTSTNTSVTFGFVSASASPLTIPKKSPTTTYPISTNVPPFTTRSTFTVSTDFTLTSTEQTVVTLSTATATVNPMPSVVTCIGADQAPQGNATTLYMLGQSFCAGGPTHDYGGWWPDGPPDDLRPFDTYSTLLAIYLYPGRTGNQDNLTGPVYAAGIVGTDNATYESGEWFPRRCENFFAQIMALCDGYFGGVAYDDRGVSWQLGLFDWPMTHNIYNSSTPPCWDPNQPAKPCTFWEQRPIINGSSSFQALIHLL